jgi:hypothetical protein
VTERKVAALSVSWVAEDDGEACPTLADKSDNINNSVNLIISF